MSKRRRWIPIVAGIAIFFVFLIIGGVIAGVAFFQQNVQMETASEGEALSEFDKVRQRFAGRAPLLEMRNGRPGYHPNRPAPPSNPAEIDSLHVLAWDPEDEHLARVTIPFWLVRMKSGPIEFSAYASGLDDERVNLTPADIEKYGPGIILDATSRHGERILLWTQ
jgi:hypothetical protein